MVIYLKSGGKLREKLKPDVDQYTRRIEVEEGLSLKQILERFDIPHDQVAFAYVDGSFKRLDYQPQDGQVITLQPPVSGG
ncbi:MAG: MoaD/ThiS family protein [candidate division KSB1 bacterium]|nr:MoaD/ThiS family protein [candidate division KSB1 bacterium]MDZ7334178.1 MoaD/ThiS family protein [candidate division KSB1 bacterium]MDZ7357315.1 MoaD/ThiS family protein [candidate division KSB1 bacterium]MDZ7377375.1 MoaD/ThiS family protein [candidate division KSB1 bacterium]MDZ7400871.1 MoaD/ThiS family protein [candidate division KSB1 bacterium]